MDDFREEQIDQKLEGVGCCLVSSTVRMYDKKEELKIVESHHLLGHVEDRSLLCREQEQLDRHRNNDDLPCSCYVFTLLPPLPFLRLSHLLSFHRVVVGVVDGCAVNNPFKMVPNCSKLL